MLFRYCGVKVAGEDEDEVFSALGEVDATVCLGRYANVDQVAVEDFAKEGFFLVDFRFRKGVKIGELFQGVGQLPADLRFRQGQEVLAVFAVEVDGEVHGSGELWIICLM